jgi:methyl-accepting chemotaxis protein
MKNDAPWRQVPERLRSDPFLSFNLMQVTVTVGGALVLLLFMFQAVPVLAYYPGEVLIRGLIAGGVGGAVAIAANARYLLALRTFTRAAASGRTVPAEAAERLSKTSSNLPARLLILTVILWTLMPLLLGLWLKLSRIVGMEDAIRLGLTGLIYSPIQGLLLFYCSRLTLRGLGRRASAAGIELEETSRGRLGLRAKLVVGYACLAAVPLLAGLMVTDVSRERQVTEANLDRVCAALGQAYAQATAVDPPDWRAAFKDNELVRSAPPGTAFQVTDRSGNILFGNLDLDGRMFWQGEIGRRESADCYRHPVPGGSRFLVLSFFRDPEVWVGAETGPRPPRASLARRYGGTLILAAVLIGLGLLLALLASEDVSAPLRELSRAAELASRGEYVRVSGVAPGDELGGLALGFNRLLALIERESARSNGRLDRAREASVELADRTARIQGIVARNRQVIDEQSSLSVEASGGCGEVTRAAAEIKERAHRTQSQMEEVVQACRDSAKILQGVTSGMGGIVQGSADLGREMEALEQNYRRMEEVIRIIDEIAESTEMLGLNAALEVGREEGRGGRFAVVATEVQHLSERIGQQTSDIKKLFGELRGSSLEMAQTIEAGRDRAAETPRWIEKLGQAIVGIEKRSGGASESMREIVGMTDQQSRALDRMKVMVTEIQSVAAVMDEVSAGAEGAMERLNELSDRLKKILS